MLDSGHICEWVYTHLQQHAHRVCLAPMFHNAPANNTVEVYSAKLNKAARWLNAKPFSKMRALASDADSHPVLLGNGLVRPQRKVRKRVADGAQVLFD